MTAVLFGSISTLADTSEAQRIAFNDAFAEHGLDWHWEREEYAALLGTAGGKNRVAEYAKSRGEQVDVEAIHQTKSQRFQTLLADGVDPRPGVIETMNAAKAAGLKIGFVTTTSTDNVEALLAALRAGHDLPDFDVVLDSGQVDQPKPDPSSYEKALAELGLEATDCVAIEDNIDGLRAAIAAGIACVSFPNSNTTDHIFEGAAAQMETLDLAVLRAVIA